MSKTNYEINEKVKAFKKKPEPLTPSYHHAKRIIDLVLSLILLFILSPLLLIISAFYLFDGGALFFKQLRYGKDGKMFYIYKFRSMVRDAENVLKSDKQLYKKYILNNYKLEPDEDPRITRLGRFLRRTSLDELPQLINVLKGEMSMVGPRPIIDDELKEYGERKSHFLSVKPGVTGYWQVSGRSAVGYPERVDVELYYVYHQSIWLDLKIIVNTVSAVIKKRGAY